MKQSEWVKLLVNDAFNNYKYYQPTWKVTHDKNTIYIKDGENANKNLSIYINRNDLYITYKNKEHVLSEMVLVDNDTTLYTGRGSLFTVTPYQFCEQIKYHGFDYQNLNKIFQEIDWQSISFMV